jgi:hypothetical protein
MPRKICGAHAIQAKKATRIRGRTAGNAARRIDMGWTHGFNGLWQLPLLITDI